MGRNSGSDGAQKGPGGPQKGPAGPEPAATPAGVLPGGVAGPAQAAVHAWGALLVANAQGELLMRGDLEASCSTSLT